MEAPTPLPVPEGLIAETGRALVIDDDRATLEATGALLSSWGWEIDLRDRLGAAEMDALSRPDILICDYDLRQAESGLEVVEALRHKFDGLPAFLMTGSSSPGIIEQIREAGLVVLLKPVRPVQLRSALIGLAG